MRLHSNGKQRGGVAARAGSARDEECGWHSFDFANGRFRMSQFVASWVSGCLLIVPLIAAAADATGPARGADLGPMLEPVIVTGSYIRRTDTESPSPVDVINADDIIKSGKTSIADVIHSLSSDNS